MLCSKPLPELHANWVWGRREGGGEARTDVQRRVSKTVVTVTSWQPMYFDFHIGPLAV